MLHTAESAITEDPTKGNINEVKDVQSKPIVKSFLQLTKSEMTLLPNLLQPYASAKLEAICPTSLLLMPAK